MESSTFHYLDGDDAGQRKTIKPNLRKTTSYGAELHILEFRNSLVDQTLIIAML